MSDEQSSLTARKGGGMLNILLWVFLALMAYVLSVGPVARFYKNKMPPQSVQIFYGPLIILSDNVTPAQKFFRWYVKIWTGDNN